MSKIKGTPQVGQPGEWQPYKLLKSHRYDGPINRDYERLQKYSIAYPDKSPYTVSSPKNLAQLKCIHPKAEVKKV